MFTSFTFRCTDTEIQDETRGLACSNPANSVSEKAGDKCCVFEASAKPIFQQEVCTSIAINSQQIQEILLS